MLAYSSCARQRRRAGAGLFQKRGNLETNMKQMPRVRFMTRFQKWERPMFQRARAVGACHVVMPRAATRRTFQTPVIATAWSQRANGDAPASLPRLDDNPPVVGALRALQPSHTAVPSYRYRYR